MSSNLLLYSSHPEDQVFAAEIAQICSLSLAVVSELNEALDRIASDDPVAILMDASHDERFFHFEKGIQERFGLFSDKINVNRLHYICSEDLEHVKHLAQSALFGNYIYRKYKDSASAKLAGERYAYVVRASLLDRAFGLKNFFNEKAQIQTIKLQKSTQKQSVVEAIRSYLIKAKYPTRMANVIANAVDELVMNSIFTAPVDELGRRIYDQTPRDTEIALEGRYAVDVTVAFDGRQVGISATDGYGAIDKEKLIRHLSTVYTDEQYKVRTSVAGAGIGLASTFRSGGSLVFVCDKNAKTEVGVIFERFENYREFKDQFRYVVMQFNY